MNASGLHHLAQALVVAFILSMFLGFLAVSARVFISLCLFSIGICFAYLAVWTEQDANWEDAKEYRRMRIGVVA